MTPARPRALGLLALAGVWTALSSGPATAAEGICADCLQIRVGPPKVVRGPFPDELDSAFAAFRLPDGRMRGFSANSTTYAIDGQDLADMAGPRRPVLAAGEAGSRSDCGRWLTAIQQRPDELLGFVHQERACDYTAGRTDKSMAIAISVDDGLSWTDLGTVISGRDGRRPDAISGEGDCSLLNGEDGFYYAYCLRNADWQTIAARARIDAPLVWHKYYEGSWDEPGLGGAASAIGFIGTGAGFLATQGWVAAVATDPWFGGLRLSLSADKVGFVDLDEPLLSIDGSDWQRPAETDLIAYAGLLDAHSGSTTIRGPLLLSYVYVPPGKGFESRHLVQHAVTLVVGDTPVPVQVGMALTRWGDGTGYVTSTGPLTGARSGLRQDRLVAYMLTRAPQGSPSRKIAECGRGPVQKLAVEGSCAPGFVRERTAGWLFAEVQPGTVPVYGCRTKTVESYFAASAANCDGLGVAEGLLGYGLTP